jgi:tetratricopeptide (TPR) repeat protein
MSDIAEAQRHWQLVRRLSREAAGTTEAAELGIVSCRQILIIGWFIGLSEEEERDVFEEGKRWIGLIGDHQAEAHLEYSYSLSRTLAHGDLKGGLAHGLEAERLAEQAGNPDLALILAGSRIVTLEAMGRIREAISLLDRTIEATRDRPEAGLEVWGMSHHVWAICARGRMEGFTGDLEKSKQMLDGCIEQARIRGERDLEVWALAALGEHGLISGDFEASLIASRKAAEIADRVGSLLSRIIAYTSLGCMLTLNGLHEEAVAVLEQGLSASRRWRTHLSAEAEVLACLAEAHLAAGNLAEARTTAEAGVSAGQRIGSVQYEARAHHALGRVLLRQSGKVSIEEARKILDRADALHAKTGSRNFQALVRMDLAELARLEGDPGVRKQELEEALRLFHEMKAPIRVREVEQLLADAK